MRFKCPWQGVFSKISRMVCNILKYQRFWFKTLKKYTVAASQGCSLNICVPENSCFCCQYIRNTNFKQHFLEAASKYSFENIINMSDLRAILRRVFYCSHVFCSFKFYNRGYYQSVYHKIGIYLRFYVKLYNSYIIKLPTFSYFFLQRLHKGPNIVQDKRSKIYIALPPKEICVVMPLKTDKSFHFVIQGIFRVMFPFGLKYRLTFSAAMK